MTTRLDTATPRTEVLRRIRETPGGARVTAALGNELVAHGLARWAEPDGALAGLVELTLDGARTLAFAEELRRRGTGEPPAEVPKTLVAPLFSWSPEKFVNPGGSAEHRRPLDPAWLSILVEEVGEVARVLNDERHAHPDRELGPDAFAALRAELVQVGAMAAAWIDSIDTRRNG